MMTSQPSDGNLQRRAIESDLQRASNSNCSFLVDLSDIQSMKQNLQDLLTSFRAGQLKAFGGKNTLEQMENIRNMQGKLARLHYGLDSQVNHEGLEDSPDDLKLHDENMTTLLQNLDGMGTTIKALNSPSASEKKEPAKASPS